MISDAISKIENFAKIKKGIWEHYFIVIPAGNIDIDNDFHIGGLSPAHLVQPDLHTL